MKVLRKLLLAAVLFYLPFQSMAWGMLGHRIVAEIAESYLTKRACRQVKNILGFESMAITSNWPDFIKSDTSFNYLGPWHYINLREGLAEAEIEAILAKDTTVNAYTKINFLTEQLKNHKLLTQDKKLMYLRLLIHIVGDVHQPMHVGRFEDLGGNRIKLYWFNEPCNLHSLWDEKLIDYQQLSYTEYAASINHTTKEQRRELQRQPVSQWIISSYKIAQGLYAGVKPEQKLSYRYNFDHVQTMNDQLLKGGVHLAGLLNEIFG